MKQTSYKKAKKVQIIVMSFCRKNIHIIWQVESVLTWLQLASKFSIPIAGFRGPCAILWNSSTQLICWIVRFWMKIKQILIINFSPRAQSYQLQIPKKNRFSEPKILFVIETTIMVKKFTFCWSKLPTSKYKNGQY